MKVCAVNFSYSNDSMGMRGLQLLNECKPFDSIINVTDYNIPVCDSNKADGVVLPQVEKMFNDMCGYDAYVFSIAEYSGAYCVGFKNIMDWFVVKTFYNSTLGQGYPFTNKPIAVVTFTPTTNNGDRHFGMTEKLLKKLGGTVVTSIAFQNGWNTVVPNNSKHFEQTNLEILNKLEHTQIDHVQLHPKAQRDAMQWITKYDDWNEQWQTLD